MAYSQLLESISRFNSQESGIPAIKGSGSQTIPAPPIQVTLFDLLSPALLFPPIQHEPPNSTPEERSIPERFEQFHRLNPHIYDLLRDMAIDMRRRGIRRYGMKGLFEVLRWRYAIQTHGEEGFKLNNNFTAHYARKLMMENPELDGFFETRLCRG